VDIGLKSFEAVTNLRAGGPARNLVEGRQPEGGHLFRGIIAGFTVWIYTLLIPALMRASIIEKGGILEGVFSSTLLNPTALFGLQGLDRWGPTPCSGACS